MTGCLRTRTEKQKQPNRQQLARLSITFNKQQTHANASTHHELEGWPLRYRRIAFVEAILRRR